MTMWLPHVSSRNQPIVEACLAELDEGCAQQGVKVSDYTSMFSNLCENRTGQHLFLISHISMLLVNCKYHWVAREQLGLIVTCMLSSPSISYTDFNSITVSETQCIFHVSQCKWLSDSQCYFDAMACFADNTLTDIMDITSSGSSINGDICL